MPNYRYNTPDSMRRNGCSHPAARPAQSPSVRPTQSMAPSCARPACDDDRAMRDELRNLPLAMAYVPWQQWCDIYEAEKGFSRGTIFQELDKPFKGTGGCCR